MQLNFLNRLLRGAERPTDVAFAYTVRESRRARSVSLRVSAGKGLEVVVPRGVGRSFIPDLINRRKEWIRSAIKRVEERSRLFPPEPPWAFPTQVELPAIGRKWRVEVDDSKRGRPSLVEREAGVLRLRGCGTHQKLGRRLLQKWLIREARKHLVPWLEELSVESSKSFGRVSIRRQRTRLGSCSIRKTISLNAKLLLLSPEQARYIMLHELCHTVELNHSRRFWAVVAGVCPGYESIEASLKKSCKELPSWANDP